MDFTFKKIELLYQSLKSKGFLFYTFSDYIQGEALNSPFVILRHDVEARYENALYLAKIQHEIGIRGSYYFRLLPKSYNGNIIKEIAALGHEIGYHYDDLSYCKGNYEKAFQRFQKNLAILRNIAPVTTIAMEGAPLSKYDNRDLWKKYDYKKLGIIGEPYFDIDFNKMLYLTDTGRRWDGWRVSIRDKMTQQGEWIGQGLVFHTTNDIIKAAEQGKLPGRIMMTFHPQRWNDRFIPWFQELVFQNIKNQVKRFLVKR
ncbi:MAG: hypothetical protein K8S18_16710 [Desulfobacula sp.]|nr:hypothetical protein [Desulfobacula sp.]